jgi:uncharacterized protein YdhG (YjbR/CyaY superfamily)
MAKTDYKSVDQYFAAQPGPARAVLQRVRDIVKRAVPGAEELISYQIPAYRHGGGYFLYISGWKAHYSLYPATEALVAALKDDIAPHLANKNTIRFKLSDPVPARLIERIAKLRAKEVAEKAKAKASKIKASKIKTAKIKTAKPKAKR